MDVDDNDKTHFTNVKSSLIHCASAEKDIDPFVANAPFLCPLKTSENRKIVCFQGVRKDVLRKNGLMMVIKLILQVFSLLWSSMLGRTEILMMII